MMCNNFNSNIIGDKLVNVDPLTFLIQECTLIISAMRKNSKWNQSSNNGGLSTLLSNTFSKDTSPFLDDDFTRISDILKSKNNSNNNLQINSNNSNNNLNNINNSSNKNSSNNNSSSNNKNINNLRDATNILNKERHSISSNSQKSIDKISSNGNGLIGSNKLISDNNNSNSNNNNNSHNNNNNNNNVRQQTDHYLSSFLELRSILTELNSIDDINVLTLLQPFLLVIRSPNTSNYITSITVNSLSKLMKYGIINKKIENINQYLPQIISSLAHCKFEGSDQNQDDILLIKILQTIESIVLSEFGDLLDDDSMFEAVSTCFSLSINSRRREILRSVAETTLINITERMFKKLKDIHVENQNFDHNKKSISNQAEFNPETDHRELPKDLIGGEVSNNNSSSNIDQIESTITDTTTAAAAATTTTTTTEVDQDANRTTTENIIPENIDPIDPIDSNQHIIPFGIPCMREFMAHSIGILSPENKFRFTESSRILSLNILNKIVEITGKDLINHQPLFQLLSDDTCHHLVQLIKESENPTIITEALNLFLNMFFNLHDNLKIQIELIITTIFECIISKMDMLDKDLLKNNDRVLNMAKNLNFEIELLTEKEIDELSKEFSSSHSNQIKEILIELISVLWLHKPGFIVDLFKNYDCDFDRSDLSVSIIKILCRLSLSDSTLFTTEIVPPLCMDGLSNFLESIYSRVRFANKNGITLKDILLINDPLLIQQNKKTDFIECTEKWNEKPKLGLKLLNEKGFINDLNDLNEVATFLLEKSGRIDKKILGEVIAKPENKELLISFVNLFDFRNLRVDEAMRMLLNNFRLPGESQQIERIMDVFCDRYLECQENSNNDDDDTIKESNGIDSEEDDEEEKVSPDKDALFVLTYSIIMLNTDSHNPNVKNPMTLEQYQRNLRGVYFGKDFPAWYLSKIYHNIKDKEIILADEHKGTTKWFETVWHSLIAEQNSKSLNESNKDDTNSNNKLSKSENTYDEIKNSLPFDRILFSKTWDFILSTLITTFEDTTHDSIVTKMMSIIEKCSSIAAFFEMDDVLDKIVETVAHLTTLTGIKKPESDPDRDVLPIIEMNCESEKEIITVSELAVVFGRDFRAQLSTVVLLRIIKRTGYKIMDNTWKWIIQIVLKLFENGLINPQVFPEFENRLNLEPLTRPHPDFEISRNKVLKESGLFSTFSSYLKGLSDDTPEPTDEEVECTLSTIDCIRSSNLMSIFVNVSKTQSDNLNKLIKIIISNFPTLNITSSRYYLEESLFLLEIGICLSLLTTDKIYVDDLIKKCDEITNCLSFQIHSNVFVRLLSYKLLLLNSSTVENIDLLNNIVDNVSEVLSGKYIKSQQEKEKTQKGQPKFKLRPLKSIDVKDQNSHNGNNNNSNDKNGNNNNNNDKNGNNNNNGYGNKNSEIIDNPRDFMNKYSNTLLQPLEMLILTNDSWFRKDLIGNNKYWASLRMFASIPKNTENVYQFLETLLKDVDSGKEILNYGNYLDILGLLDEISAVGAYGAQWEQEYEKLVSSGHRVEKNNNPFQELVSTALKSITLTIGLNDIISTEEFVLTIPINKPDSQNGTAASENNKTVAPQYPLIEAIAHQCYNPCRELRAHALKCLENLLISINDKNIKDSRFNLSPKNILDGGCLRLLVELLKPDVESTDLKGMLVTQRAVVNLSCKVILIYDFGTNSDYNQVVSKLLTIANKFLNKNGDKSNFKDELIEILKNMLYVLHSKLDLDSILKLNLSKPLHSLIVEMKTTTLDEAQDATTPEVEPSSSEPKIEDKITAPIDTTTV
ncbi:hypothetical protein B5S28_g1065 [[Candida] boidinii]|nr:hypothetical protein B5S28_g1065 [[Candida] boidinii]